MRGERQRGGEASLPGPKAGSDCSEDALIPKHGEVLEFWPARRWATRAIAAAAVVLGVVAALQACCSASDHARGAVRSAALTGKVFFEEAGPLVDTPVGLLRGTLEDGVVCFNGVPFAQPPARFAAPEPVEPWVGVRDAKKMPRACQPMSTNASSAGTASVSEDCLLLNICTRADSLLGGAELQPVVVVFHAGAFNGGRCPEYGKTWFTRLTGGVLVCPQYRLGAFGFFSPSATPPVLGLQDQQLALMWVQQNARAFGGDPDRVLISGGSAGGASVAGHLVLPSSAGLFTSASLVSPGSHLGWKAVGAHGGPDDWITPEDSLRSSTALAQKLGCQGPADLECLRAASAEEVVEAARAPGMRFAPALPDGEFPLGLIRKGKWKRVPVVVGGCSCEGCPRKTSTKSLLAGPDISDKKFRADLLGYGFNEAKGATVGPELIERWYAGRLREENRSQVKLRVSGDSSHTCSAKLHADALQHGADPAHSGVWRVYFDLFGSEHGIHMQKHGCTSFWIFGDPGSSAKSWTSDPGEPGAPSLHVNMAHWWYSLAAFGDPNVGSTSSLRWPEYSAESPQTLIVDKVPWVGVTEDTQAKECSHWQKYFGW